MSQNRSHAVMAQRAEARDSLDDFPTPPWATRAFVEHVLIGGGWNREKIERMTCREPACNRGYMARALIEYFASVDVSDVHDYGYARIADFLFPTPLKRVDWTITNPPFRLAEQFIQRALETSRVGVAMLVRSSFMEGTGRYRALFSRRPPAIFAPYVERVAMVKGRLDRHASTATSYSWLVWSNEPHHAGRTIVRWIPPCRKQFDRDADWPAEAAVNMTENGVEA